MFSRALRPARVLPLRSKAVTSLTKRSKRAVTTDAASSHTDKGNVPNVSVPLIGYCSSCSRLIIDDRKMISPLKSSSQTKPSKPTS